MDHIDELESGEPKQDEPSVAAAIAEAAPMAEGDESARLQALEERELKAILESLLFVTAEPVPLERLMVALGTVSRIELRQALQSLREDFDRDGRGVQVVELAGGYQMVTRAEYAPWITRLAKAKASPKLSRSAMESLAIIAYKQPIVRSEIEQIRGVEVSGVLRTLLERKLIRMVGRKDVPGRPIMYGTTKLFLQQFGLSDLSQLPPLREFKELGEAEQAMLPVEDGLQIGDQETVATGTPDESSDAEPSPQS
ncbi:MAG TPA: SMC-Scp complex subunit ScpB [Nitrospiraceae bacterium]|jgi:segregation and condensation protein B